VLGVIDCMMKLAAVALLAAGCSQRVYSPPSQLFAVSPIAALPDNQRAFDVDISTHSQIFDPSVNAGTGRLRHGIGDNAEVSVEGSVAAVADSGPSKADRSFYTGRAGVRTNPGEGPLTFFAGAGGGYAPAGGTFGALDAGVVVGIPNCTFVPTFQASGFVSEPLDPRPIDVSDDPKYVDYDTPSRTVGGVLRGGVRIGLSPSACRRGEQEPWLVAGFGVTKVMDIDSDDAIPGAGIGIEIPLTQ
jgi:hypothetical protein